MVRIGSALFNSDHTRLGEELRRVEAAGIDFFHFDVFDGYFVLDQAFPARTIQWLRPLSKRPFEVHLAANDPSRFLAPLADAGVDLVFLPAESTPLFYETIFSVRERGMQAGLCLALGTPLTVLSAVLAMIDSVLLLGRVTGEGKRGRDFNKLVVERVRMVRRMIDESGYHVDLQAAGGLEMPSCIDVCEAGVTSLPLGGALHRETDMAAFVSNLRSEISQSTQASRMEDRTSRTQSTSSIPNSLSSSVTPFPSARDAEAQTFNVLVASRSFGQNCPEVLEAMRAAGCRFLCN
jgi:ribulose-phosphate 3-epimerase